MDDQFDTNAKMAYRADCLRFLRKRGKLALFTPNGRLLGKWVELAGETGHLSLDMLTRENVLVGKQFVGVDSNRSHISKHRRSRPHATWICDRLESALPNLNGVCVMNVDGYTGTGTDSSRALLGAIHGVARRSRGQFGSFGLLFNSSVTAARRNRVLNPIEAHVHSICDIVSSWGCFASLDPRIILPELGEIVLPRSGEGRALSEYVYIYRGDDRNSVMVNVKLVLR